MILNRRVRLFFRTGEVDREIAWFQMKADDLYFGPAARAGIDAPLIPIRGREIQIRIPDEIRRLENKGLTASYHASGQFHIKASGSRQSPPVQWPKKDPLISPFRVGVLITKVASSYPEYTRSLIRGGADTVILRLKDFEADLRHYLEFFISPPGAFERPTPMLNLQGDVLDKPICRSLSEQFILVIRHFTFAAAMPLHTWHSDVEVWFFADEVEPGVDHETRI